jgi:hypothetical protein
LVATSHPSVPIRSLWMPEAYWLIAQILARCLLHRDIQEGSELAFG